MICGTANRHHHHRRRGSTTLYTIAQRPEKYHSPHTYIYTMLIHGHTRCRRCCPSSQRRAHNNHNACLLHTLSLNSNLNAPLTCAVRTTVYHFLVSIWCRLQGDGYVQQRPKRMRIGDAKRSVDGGLVGEGGGCPTRPNARLERQTSKWRRLFDFRWSARAHQRVGRRGRASVGVGAA